MTDEPDLFGQNTTFVDRLGRIVLIGLAGGILLALITATILSLWSTDFWVVTPVSFVTVALIFFAILREQYVPAFMAGLLLLTLNFGLGVASVSLDVTSAGMGATIEAY